MKLIIVVIALVVGLFVLTGCEFPFDSDAVQGEGALVAHTLDVEDFTGIYLSGAYVLTFRQAEYFSVVLEIQENLFAYLEPTVSRSGANRMLRLNASRDFNIPSGYMPRLYVYAPSLTMVHISGAVDAYIDLDLDAESFSLIVDGVASATLTGFVTTLAINLNGVGDVEAFDLQANHANVTVNGVGSVNVWAVETLNATVRGVGSIHYIGNPTVTRNISSLAGSVSRARRH